MLKKSQLSHFHILKMRLNITDLKSKKAIKLIWDPNKPSKLQTFFWKINLGDLSTCS